jgi:hypothetical protein
MLFLLLVGLVSVYTVCSLQFGRHAVLKPFVDGRALKVISGLTNLDETIVKNVVIAASIGGASHVDIACNAKLVRSMKSISSIPICVSSITPSEFVGAVEAGADMIEIGNFDGFYDCGMKFSAEDVLKLAREARQLLPNVPLSATIPHTLSLNEQICLAKSLETAGVDIIQTEGKVAGLERSQGNGVTEMIEIAVPALASTYAISRAVSIPVMASSGLSDVTAPLALSAGAKGIGVGSAVHRLKNKEQMILAVRAIANAMGRPSCSTDSVDIDADIGIKFDYNRAHIDISQL